MKAIKLLTASSLFAGLLALGFAGPSPQFSNQQAKNQPAPTTAAAKAIKVCASCACCSARK